MLTPLKNVPTVELMLSRLLPFQVINFGDDKNWFKAEQDGRSGLVPANYIQLKPHR